MRVVGSAEVALTLGPFVLEEAIGAGAMGEVWRARHARDGVAVAVKVLRAEITRREAFVARFRDEVRAVARLDHPSVVLLFDYGTVPEPVARASAGRLVAGSPYLVMELCSGGTLADRPPASFSRLRDVLLDILAGLGHAHARGIVHRDLKPENILVGTAWDLRPGIKVTDFGLARSLDSSQSPDAPGTIVGTPRYMAPEQLDARWRDIGPAADLYAVGNIAYELASGRSAFEGKTAADYLRAHRGATPRRLAPRMAVPDELEAWVLRLLEKSPRRRFRCAADAAHALSRMVAPEEEPASGASARVGRRAGLPEGGVLTQAALAPEEAPTEIATATLSGDGPLAWARVAGAIGAGGAAEVSPCEATPPPMCEAPGERRTTRWAKLGGVGLAVHALRAPALVGRRDERQALWRALTEVHASGEPRAVVLTGPAGIGKSRLAEWLLERAYEEGAATSMRALHGPAQGAGQGLARMAARHLDALGLPRAEVVARVRRDVAESGAGDDYDALALGEIIDPAGATAAGERVLFSEPAQRRAVLCRLVQRAARERPVIVWLDDVPWDEEALLFAEQLLSARGAEDRRRPILLVATAEDGALAERAAERALLEGIATRPGALRLVLAPLPEEDRGRLSEELLDLSGELAARLEAKAAGNPLFAVQLVGSWVERGVLEPTATGFRLRPGELPDPPSSLAAVWRARLARALAGLPERAHVAIELAAALGPVVERHLWDAACAQHLASSDVAEPLLAASLLIPADDEGRTFSFAHGMLREVLEQQAREAGRWRAHNAVLADVLAPGARAGDLDSMERRGRCLLAAGEPDAAWSELLGAAIARRDRGEARLALGLLGDAEEALRLGASAGAAGSRAVSEVRASVFVRQGKVDAALEIALRTIGEAREQGVATPAEALLVAANAHGQRGELDSAVPLFEEALAGFDRAGDDAGVCKVLRGLAHTHRLARRLDAARACLDRLMEIALRVNDDVNVGWALNGLAIIAYVEGKPHLGVELAGSGLTRFERAGAYYGVAVCVNTLAEAERRAGDLASARRDYERALELSELLGLGTTPIARHNLGLVLLREGNIAAASEQLARCRQEAEQRGQRTLVAAAHGALTACAAAAGDAEAFDRHLAHGLAGAEAVRLLDDDFAASLALAAEHAATRGDAPRARQAAIAAAAHLRALGHATEADDLDRRFEPLA